MKAGTLRLAALLAALGLLAAPLAASPRPAAGSPDAAVVLIPFANVSGAERAPAEFAAGLAKRLAAKGWRVVSGEPVEAFLAKERVRYLDSLSTPVRAKLLASLGAGSVLLGTVARYDEGANPLVSVSARMLRADGTCAWAAVAGMSADETEGALGLGRAGSPDELAGKAVARLAKSMPRPGSSASGPSFRATPAGNPPRTFRSSAFEGETIHRVCLLPLETRTPSRQAGRIVSEALARRLEASSLFDVVEAADFREAMVAAKLRGLKSGDPAELARLGKALDTSLFLCGAIEQFADASPSDPSSTPRIELQIELVDTAAGKILWTSSLARKGTDYRGLLELGAISNALALADQMAAEMVRALERTTPGGAAALETIVGGNP